MTQIIENEIAQFLRMIKKDKNLSFSYDDDLFELSVLDSFAIIEYIAYIEDEFGLDIPNEDLIPQNFWSVNATATLIRKYKKDYN